MRNRILHLVSRLKVKGSFIRNVSITSSWNISIAVVQFLLSPIITRIYPPEEYGVFALFNSIVVNLALISTFKYSEAIVVAESKTQRNNTIYLSFLLVTGVSVLTELAILVFKDQILSFFNLKEAQLSHFIYLIPVSIFFSGVLEIILVINVTRKKFFRNGLSGFLMNLLARVYIIGYSKVFFAKALGLISGDIFGKLVGIIAVLTSFANLRQALLRFYNSLSLAQVRIVAHLHRHFPLYTLPTQFLWTFSGHLPIYLLQYKYTSAVVGAFALSSSLMEVVNKLIPYSVAGVFLPKAMEMKNESWEQLVKGLHRLYWPLYWLALAIFIGIALLSQILFPWFFGDSWKLAGTVTAILTLQYAFNFIAVPVSEICKVIGKQRFLFVSTVISVSLKVMAVITVLIVPMDERFALLTYSAAGAIGGVMQILGIFIIFKHRILVIGASLLAFAALLFACTYFVIF